MEPPVVQGVYVLERQAQALELWLAPKWALTALLCVQARAVAHPL